MLLLQLSVFYGMNYILDDLLAKSMSFMFVSTIKDLEQIVLSFVKEKYDKPTFSKSRGSSE